MKTGDKVVVNKNYDRSTTAEGDFYGLAGWVVEVDDYFLFPVLVEIAGMRGRWAFRENELDILR